MSRLSPGVLVIILMVSLLLIFLIPGNSNLNVGTIQLVILGLGLVLAFTGRTIQQRETGRKMLATLAGITAVASAALVGQAMVHNLVGFVCAPVLLAAAYVSFIAVVSRAGLVVEEGELLVSRRRMDHQHIIRPPGLHSPIVNGLESAVAVMPTYDIQTEVSVENVDTVSFYKVDRINVDTTCRIIQHYSDPNESISSELRYEGFLKLPYHYPNRDRVFKDLADDIGVSVQEARMTAAFWIKAIQHQIAHAIDEELRSVIHDTQFFDSKRNEHIFLSTMDISIRRVEVAEALKDKLQRRVEQWGVEMLDVGITQVILDVARIKHHYKDRILETQARESERSAQMEAVKREIVATTEHRIRQQEYEMEELHQKKQVEVELAALRERHSLDSGGVLQMINELMETLQKFDTHLKPDEIQRLLLLALDEHMRLQYRQSNQSRGQSSGNSSPAS